MKRLVLAHSIALALGAALAPAAHAIEYNQVQADKSRIGFGYKQMGVAMDGNQEVCQPAQLRPGPAVQRQGHHRRGSGSIDTGTAEADSEVGGKQWFNTKAFPTARFVSTGVKCSSTRCSRRLARRSRASRRSR